jgi:hypothetical protein
MKTESHDRSEIAHREATANPIFLLQSRHAHVFPDGHWDYDSDAEGFFRLGTTPKEDDYLSAAQILKQDSEAGLYEWYTESVWFTREEAEAFGQATEYNFREGWRVFCVTACGDLAKVLRGEPLHKSVER